MFPTSYHFTVLFCKAKNQRNWIVSAYLLGIIYFFLSRTDYFVSGLYRYNWGCHTIARGLHHPFVIISTFYYLKAAYLLFIKYRGSTSFFKRQQYKYYFLGFFIYIFATIAYLPAYKIGIYPFVYWFATFYVLSVSYAIVRYRLMEIDTVLHRTILWAATSLWLIIPAYFMFKLIRPWLQSLSTLWSSIAALGLFYLFLWYYRYFQPRIDHLFRRRKYDYYQVLGEIGHKIGSELDINKIIQRLFKELKEVLYIRNGLVLIRQPGQIDYTESGSTGYEKLLEIEKKGNVVLGDQTSLSQWLNQHQKVLEREQIEVDPQYAPIKEEALTFLKRNAIEVLIPAIIEKKVNALIGIGKKENLQAYTMRDIELYKTT